MERRYHALRTIANIYRVLGYIVAVLTILSILAICGLSVISGTAFQTISQDLGVNTRASGVAGSIFGGLIVSLIVLIYGGVVAISLIAFGEGIYLLIAVEENTRKTALLLQNQPKVTLPAAQAQIPAP
jgi:hypothetical protein